MRDVPECLHRRYKALDELIKEISTQKYSNHCSSDDPGIKLMCDFWNILKEDPDVDLTAVQQRLGTNTHSNSKFGHQQVSCYMAGCCNRNEDKKQESKPKHTCGRQNTDSAKSKSPQQANESLPLNNVLCNLKEVASFEKKCQAKVNDLSERQKQLQQQIQVLEEREKGGVQKLKEADCMWSCMEESYKKKIAESMERQKNLLKQLKEAEASSIKWRKNKKDLDFQMDHISKCHQEIKQKINEKQSDIKCIDIEISNFKTRIESNKKDLEGSKKSLDNKKKASDAKIAKIATEAINLEKTLKQEYEFKKTKEQEGIKYVKEAREDLQKLCKVLLQMKLENEDMAAEREALLLEVDLLKESADQCKDKCKHKEDNIKDEIKVLDKEIAEYKVKCIQCHECTDTVDIRKFCTDCPRCISERDCLYENDKCSPDHSLDCVCTSVKQKFLDNVFDNMYSILERQIKTGPGKAVAEAVLNCLKKSRNGKINSETKKILQDFILTTIKKNLRLTVIGGAFKTRCEMDKETYDQLMLCLKQVKVTKPVKADQGTDAKKEPCQRWGGTSECNCPNGPKQCICTKKALPQIKEPTSCPPEKDKEDTGEVVLCPHKESAACGVDCAMRTPSAVGFEVAQWRPDPCQEPTCQFKNMRAVQCVLGPEAISPVLGTKIFGDQNTCKCGSYETGTCVCQKDSKHVKAGLDKSCDKNTCTSVFEQKTSGSIIEESKLTLIKERPNVDKHNTIIKETPNPNKKIDQSPQKHHKQHKKIPKKIDSNADDQGPTKILLKDKIISTKEIVEDAKVLPKLTKVSPKVTKSSSEKIAIDIPNKEDSSCKRYCSKNERLSCSSLTKFLLKTSEQIESTCKKNKHKKTEKMYKLKVLGININREPLFALKEENSGQFKVLLDKEHEKYQREMIKSCEGNNCKEFANLKKTTSGHFTLDLNRKKEDAGKPALIVKSESGSLQVLTDKSKIDFSLERDSVTRKSVLSAHALKRLLKRLPSRTSMHSNKSSNRSQIISIKSNSDSSLYEKVKFNIHNHHNLLIDPSVLLRKTCSGEYTLVLSKESKKAFINNVQHYLSSSSKGQVPIKVTASGVIIVDVNTIRNNKKHYGSLKITPSGNIFVSLDDDSVKVLSKETVLDKVNPCSCKAISTTCNAQFQDGSCDKSKCVCKNICYKSKKWFYEHTATKSSITTKCGIDKKIDNIFDCFNICDSIESECLFRDHNERKLLHEDTNNYSCETKLEHDFDKCYHVNETVCPYHDYQHENMAHESEIHITFKDSELIKEPIKEVYTKDNIRHDWNSLEYLPPQLPQFLKDFTYNTCKCGSYETGTCVCQKDSKHVKAGLDKSCDKNTCTSVFEQKTSGSIIEESKLTLIKERPNVDKHNTIIKETPNPNKKIDQSPQKHHKQHKKIPKKIDSNADDQGPTKILLKDKIISTKEIVEDAKVLPKLTKVSPKVTKSSSEKIAIDIPNKEDSSCKRYCSKNERLSCSSLTKFLLKTSEQIESTCKKNKHKKTEKMYKLKVLGININREPLFALKEENSGQFKVLLDKEHEKYQREMIKSCEGNNCKEFANLKKTTSGHFTLDLNRKKEDAGKPALIVKSESGSLQVLTDKSKIDFSLERDSVTRKSVLSAHALKRLLKRLPSRTSMHSNKSSNRSQIISIKSNSDSSLYEKVKFNIHNHHNLLIDPSVLLRKTCSGEYTLVLSKESKKAFINNVQHYLSSSSKGQVPIKVTASGVIIVDVNTIRNNKKHYGSLKITPSGNIFVSLDDDSVKVLSKETVLDKVNPCSCKAISTTCNAQFQDGSCDKSKCVCKNICYKSKKWFYEHTATKSSITTKCGIDKKIDNIFDCFNICDSIESECLFRDHNERKLLHEDTNNYSCETKLEHDFDKCYHVNETVCPYHDYQHENMAHESEIHITFKDSELIKEPIKEVYTKDNIRHDWNSLEYLPPQLPQFLKDFTYV